ncbi:hypothetical protein NUSPORA_02264 [Nucleospora cyclopteri]
MFLIPMVTTFQLKEDEIINLMLEAGMDISQIKEVLDKLGDDKSPENVYRLLDEYKEQIERDKIRKEDEKMEMAQKNKDMIKQQALYNETQLKRIQEKIKATQEENRKKEELEEKKLIDESPPLDTFYRFRISTKNFKTVIVGLNEGATLKDLYSLVKTKTKSSKGFVLKKFCSKHSIPDESKDIQEFFKCRSVMLELIINQ